MAGITPERVRERIEKAVSAWETMHPGHDFGVLTLARLKERVKPALDVRKEIEDLEEQLVQKRNQRDTVADPEATKVLDVLVSAVLADEVVGGKNSAMYEALGYVTESKRKSGLTRKKKADTPPAS